MANFYNSTDVSPTADQATIGVALSHNPNNKGGFFQAALTADQAYLLTRYWSIAVFLALAMLGSCNHEPTKPTAQDLPDYFPLQVGNWWEYAVDTLDSKGNFAFDHTIRAEIISDSLVGTVRYFKIKNHAVLYPVTDGVCFLYKDTNGGIMVSTDIIPSNTFDANFRYTISFNKPIDEDWNLFPKDDNPTNPFIIRIRSKTDSTQVSAGFFRSNCVVISPRQRYGPSTFPCDQWEAVYALNIGLVKLRPISGYGGSCTRTQFSLTKAHIGSVSYP